MQQMSVTPHPSKAQMGPRHSAEQMMSHMVPPPPSNPKKIEKPSNMTLEGEIQATSADNRLRRLVPYTTFYIPSNDFNFPLSYMVKRSPYLTTLYPIFFLKLKTEKIKQK